MRSKTDKSNNLQQVLFDPIGQQTRWQPPKDFPCLSSCRRIALDCETKDPQLKERGPGFIRGDAELVGVSIATDDHAWYFPMRHLGGGNLDPVNVTLFLQNLLRREDLMVVGANIRYDLEALDAEDILIEGNLTDIQLMEALIDEDQETYSLNHLCLKYLERGKDEALLKEAAYVYGVDPKAGLWKLPSWYVGPYAEFDAMSCLKILDKQVEVIRSEKLEQACELEHRLIPVLHAMRLRGIPMDIPAAEKLNYKFRADECVLADKLFKEVGYILDVWSGPAIAKYCASRGIHHPTTEKGNPSFTGEWLQSYSDPTIQLIHKIRELNRMRQTFVEDWILKNHVRGRIHPQWIQMASDEGGTRTGRMACANPNAQQVPASKYRMTGQRNEFGVLIRSLFIPEDRHKWCKFDYSQQEPRILTHFAELTKMTGASLAAEAYRMNPKMDFYQFMVEAAGIDRRPAKDMYLGRCYGMGKNKLAAKLGKSVEEAEGILRHFDETVPFVKEIAERCMHLANTRGFVRTLCGRRRHFNLWEPVDRWDRQKRGEFVIPLREYDAKERWPGVKLQRAETHKALNALIQGSAADMMKSALVMGYEQQDRVPHLTVHDELGGSVRDVEDAEEWKKIVEHCVEMRVPIKADMKIGRGWS